MEPPPAGGTLRLAGEARHETPTTEDVATNCGDQLTSWQHYQSIGIRFERHISRAKLRKFEGKLIEGLSQSQRRCYPLNWPLFLRAVNVSRQMAHWGVLASWDWWLVEGLDTESAAGPGESVRSISSSPDGAVEMSDKSELWDLKLDVWK